MFPHTYALYPYLSPRPLPLTMNTSGTFRLRRVGEWLKSGFEEDVESTGGLASEQGHVLTENEYVHLGFFVAIWDADVHLSISVSLRDLATRALPESPRTTVTAS